MRPVGAAQAYLRIVALALSSLVQAKGCREDGLSILPRGVPGKGVFGFVPAEPDYRIRIPSFPMYS